MDIFVYIGKEHCQRKCKRICIEKKQLSNYFWVVIIWMIYCRMQLSGERQMHWKCSKGQFPLQYLWMICVETKETGFDDTKMVADNNENIWGCVTSKSHTIFPPACCLSVWLGFCMLTSSSRILNNGRAVTNPATYCNCQSDSSRGRRQSKAEKSWC